MLVTEFIRRKNELIFKHTGLVLVPEDQIEECEAKPLDILYDGVACPYCQVYAYSDCPNCPMNKAKNNCGDDDSTYYGIVHEYGSITRLKQPWYKELKSLIEQYNNELED